MSKKFQKQEEEVTSYWLSYSDMMAALLLVFILIITFTILQSKTQYEEKEQQLSMQKEELADQKEQLNKLISESEQQKKIMEQQQEKLDKLVGVRIGLIEALKDEFSGSELGVQIDPQTGAITFDSSILFDYNAHVLKESGQDFLVEFLPRYINILLEDGFREYISEIIIEGHTDTKGDYLFNLELSQKRALAVASFCLTENGKVKLDNIDFLRTIITANGKSFSDPIYNDDGTVNMEKSRRVEFKFRLKDDEMINNMRDILSE